MSFLTHTVPTHFLSKENIYDEEYSISLSLFFIKRTVVKPCTITVSDSGSVSSPLTEYEFGSGKETGISNLPSLSISANDNLDERSVAGESEEIAGRQKRYRFAVRKSYYIGNDRGITYYRVNKYMRIAARFTVLKAIC